MSPVHILTLLENLGSPTLTDSPIVSHVGILLWYHLGAQYVVGMLAAAGLWPSKLCLPSDMCGRPSFADGAFYLNPILTCG